MLRPSYTSESDIILISFPDSDVLFSTKMNLLAVSKNTTEVMILSFLENYIAFIEKIPFLCDRMNCLDPQAIPKC
jgi:hypothetical protein